jgi:hypothetical protein
MENKILLLNFLMVLTLALVSSVKRNDWFSVSADGLSQHYKKTFTARELLANAFDEEADTITFTITKAKTAKFPSQFLIRIIDNDKDGFENIEDMFTLFRRTKKVDNTKIRGRFNHGEKGVLSLCNRAVLTSTRGTVKFNPSGKRTINTSITTEIGSDLKFWIDLDADELKYLRNYITIVKIPKGIKVIYCEKTYTYEEPKFQINIRLQTWKSDQKKPYYKNTEVHIYPKIKGVSYIYELGIPIQTINYPFSVDIRQKIPLDTKRNSVKSTYLEDLYGQLANNDFVIDEIDEDDMGESYVAITLSSKEISGESARKLVEKKMGSDQIMISNPFDQKSNERARESGYTLVQSRDIPKATREAIKSVGVKTTSEVFKERLVAGKVIPKADWDEGMFCIEKWSKEFDLYSINRPISVTFYNNPECSNSATYSTGKLNYNTGNLGKNFFINAKQNIDRISSLLIHELAHDYKERNMLPHLSSSYLKELERIAGKMVQWLMNENNYQSVHDFVSKH